MVIGFYGPEGVGKWCWCLPFLRVFGLCAFGGYGRATRLRSSQCVQRSGFGVLHPAFKVYGLVGC